MRRFTVYMRHPAFHTSLEHGTHEVTRVFVFNGNPRAGERGDGKIGPAVITKVVWDSLRGLTIHTDKGCVCSPVGDCQVGYEV